MQASLSLRLMHVYFLPRRNHRVRVRANIASDIASESTGMEHAERHPVGGVVLTKITLEDEYA